MLCAPRARRGEHRAPPAARRAPQRAPVARLLDAGRLDVRAVLQNDLLEPVERALVLDALAHLRHGAPHLLRLDRVARVAEEVVDHVLDHKRLLQNGAVQHLFLNRELDLEAPRVRLGPHKAGVDQLDALQPAHALQTEREQLGRLELGRDPLRRRLIVAARAWPRAAVSARHCHVAPHAPAARAAKLRTRRATSAHWPSSVPMAAPPHLNVNLFGQALADVDLIADAATSARVSARHPPRVDAPPRNAPVHTHHRCHVARR